MGVESAISLVLLHVGLPKTIQIPTCGKDRTVNSAPVVKMVDGVSELPNYSSDLGTPNNAKVS